MTRPFLRTTEFLWQEGHTAHETEAEAEEETLKILDLYAEVCESVLAMPVVKGRKSESEKFAGAARTYSIEALMGDGRALQAGTSHNLGQNFAKAFDITFQARDKSVQHVWGTSWGVTTRLVGAVIMTHGDDSGLILPPRIAPYQAVIVPIGRENWRETVLPHALQIQHELAAAGIRVTLDEREERPGWKFAEWELRGVPLRLEIGPKDIEKAQVLIARRDTREKLGIAMAGLVSRVSGLLEEVQQNLLSRAKAFREEHTQRVSSYDAFKQAMESRPGFVIAPWCGSAECEAHIKAETKATIRNMPPRAAAEIVLAELLELVPGGLEESDVSEEVVEYALYGAAGELPDLPRCARRRATSSWTSRAPRCPTTGPSAGRRGTGRSTSRGASAACAYARRGRRRWPMRRRSTSSSIRARRSAPVRTTRRGCASNCCSSSIRAARWPTGAPAAACSRSPRRGSATRRCSRSTSSPRRSRRRPRTRASTAPRWRCGGSTSGASRPRGPRP